MTAMQPSWTRSGSSPERPITMYESSSATASSHTAQPSFSLLTSGLSDRRGPGMSPGDPVSVIKKSDLAVSCVVDPLPRLR